MILIARADCMYLHIVDNNFSIMMSLSQINCNHAIVIFIAPTAINIDSQWSFKLFLIFLCFFLFVTTNVYFSSSYRAFSLNWGFFLFIHWSPAPIDIFDLFLLFYNNNLLCLMFFIFHSNGTKLLYKWFGMISLFWCEAARIPKRREEKQNYKICKYMQKYILKPHIRI